MPKINRSDFFKKRLPIYKNDIVCFSREVVGFEPDDWQREVLEALATHNRVSIRSGQGVGKTGLEAVVLLWFLSCFPYPRIIATAPTQRQLHDVLWSEVAKWQSKSPLLSALFKWTKTHIYMKGHEKRWFAAAISAAKPENMQGFHEDNMLFIVDEASGVADPIMEAILGTLSGKNNKLLMCGNPTKTTGVFYDSHHSDKASFYTSCVNAEKSERTDKKNIEMLKRKYGAESNLVRVRVYGEFPEQEDDVFIPLYLIDKAVNNKLENATIRHISFGVDVARFGDDETIIAQNIDGRISLPVIRQGQDLMRTVGDIVIQYKRAISENPRYFGKISVVIDDTGLGGGVTDRLKEVRKEQRLNRMHVVPVNFSGKIEDRQDSQHYADLATYMWAKIRDQMSDGILVLCKDSELEAQLSTRKYSITSSGKIILESKQELKKRGLPSPDRAEAVGLSCYETKRYTSTPSEDGLLIKESYWR